MKWMPFVSLVFSFFSLGMAFYLGKKAIVMRSEQVLPIYVGVQLFMSWVNGVIFFNDMKLYHPIELVYVIGFPIAAVYGYFRVKRKILGDQFLAKLETEYDDPIL